MAFYRQGGKLFRIDGTIRRGVVCCPRKCGACKFSPASKAQLTWSFSIGGGDLDLNGSGQTWDDIPTPFHTSFDASSSGSGTATLDLTGITGGGTTGVTVWTLHLTSTIDGSPDDYALTASYECSQDKWGWTMFGPGTGIFQSHDGNPDHCTHPLPLMSGNCAGVAGSNVIFSTGPGGPEFLAVGSLSITIIDNECDCNE